jgi:hypothetical protein
MTKAAQTITTTAAPLTTTLQQTTAPVAAVARTITQATMPVATTLANAATPVTQAVQTITTTAAPLTTLQQTTAPVTAIARTITQATTPVATTLAAAVTPLTRLAGAALTAGSSPVVQLVAAAPLVTGPVAQGLAPLSENLVHVAGMTPAPATTGYHASAQKQVAAGQPRPASRSASWATGTHPAPTTGLPPSVPGRVAVGPDRPTEPPSTPLFTPAPANSVIPPAAGAAPSSTAAAGSAGDGPLGPQADVSIPGTTPALSTVWMVRPSSAVVTRLVLRAVSPLAGTAPLTRTPASELLSAPPLSPAPAAPLVGAPALGGSGTGVGSSGFFFSPSAALLEMLTPDVPRLTGRLRIMFEVGRPAPFIALLAEPG